MTATRRRLVPALLTLLLAGSSGLLAAPGAAAERRPPTPSRISSSSSPDSLIQHVTVSWDPSTRRKVQVRNAVVPGIGELALVCKGNATMIRLHTEDRGLETQMWLQKYEVKDEHNVVAVKTPRIYRWAHALDDGTGGTGYYAAEGLNQRTPIENYSSGTINGIISQRPGRQQPSTAFSPKPVTSFELSWFWNGFRHPTAYRSCSIDAVLTTSFETRAGITWRGSTEALGHDRETTRIPGFGDLTLECRDEVDPTGAAQTLSFTPDAPDANLYVERVTGEGWVEDHVDRRTYGYGETVPATLGPVPLPRNGTLRMRVRVGDAERWVLVSSYYVVNNPDPRLNLCEVAAAHYAR